MDFQKIELSDRQRDSAFILTAQNDIKKIPSKFESKSLTTTEDNLPERFQLSVEFYNWLDSVEKSLDNVDDDGDNNQFIKDMKSKKQLCDDLYFEVQNCRDKMIHLKTQYISTSNKTNALHEACEHLLSDQNQYIDKAKAIEENLRYFIIVDNLTMKISFPNLKMTIENLEPILNQIDESYKYLSSKINYKESGSYLSKLKDCLWKILLKISCYFVQEINNTFAQVTDTADINQDKSFTILYGKFRSQGIKVRPFIELISSRKPVCELYKEITEECEQHFISKREHLLSRVINSSFEDLITKFPKDHCGFIRSGGSLMIRMCDDETNLFQQFFVNTESQLLNAMLTRLCTILYDAFRPFIIHINHLETLAELCCIVKVELVEDFSSKTDTPIDNMCQMILADVQERLIFRTHIYIKSQILGYSPSSGDLAYPEKLEMMISIAESMKSSSVDQTNNDFSQRTNDAAMNLTSKSLAMSGLHGDIHINPGPNMSLSPADLHGMWYPTVRRTLVCLSKLHRCLDIITFQGLAQECIALCVKSLVNGADAITKQKTHMDGQLFLIKHLLILREQVAPFNVEFTVKETTLGFRNLKDAAYGLISSRSQLLALNKSNSLIRFLLETPEVIETVVDSRHQLDGQLKSTCDDFITNCITSIVGPLNDILKKVAAIENTTTETNISVTVLDQPYSEPNKLQDLIAKSYRELSVTGKYAQIRRSLHLYLSNQDTEMILIKPIKNTIIKAYRQFNQFLGTYFSPEDCQIMSCPSDKQVALQMEVNFENLK